MAVFVVFFIYASGIIMAGVFVAKAIDQRERDLQRVCRQVHCPSDLDYERVAAFVKAFCGTMRPRGFLPSGVPSISFEMLSTPDGYIHRIKVPYQHVGYVEQALHTLIPGLSLTELEDRHDEQWTRVEEYRMTAPTRLLRINPSADDVSHTIMGSVGNLDDGEKVILQWVVTPMKPRSLPQMDDTQRETTGIKDLFWSALVGSGPGKDEIKERQDKLKEANVLAALRIGALATTPERAKYLIHQVEAALNTTRGAQTHFIKRWLSQDDTKRRLRDSTTGVRPHCQLTAHEFAAVMAWPIGRPYIPGLSPARTRPLPASASIPTEGRIIGRTNMAGKKRQVAVSYKQSVRHVYVLGPNGVGKTTLLLNLMAQDMQQGYGVILIETKGTADLFYGALDIIPDHRVDDVIVVDVDEEAMPVGFNILDQANSGRSIDDLSRIIGELYAGSTASIMAPQVLHHMLHALAEVPKHTLIDLPTLLKPQGERQTAWREWLTRQVQNKNVRGYVDRYAKMKDAEQDRLIGPVYNRTWEFTTREQIARVFGQRTSSFRMVDAIRENKIVLIKVSGSGVDERAAMLAGTLYANAAWDAAQQARAETANFLYLDEFQDISRFPIGLTSVLAKARSAKLGTVLAHQSTSQLQRELREAVMANALTKVVFQTSSDDARILAREFGRTITDQDFLNLPAHHAIVAVSTDSGVSPPTTVETPPPAVSTGNAAKALELSRYRYGRPLEDVERDMETLPMPAITVGKARPPSEPPPSPFRKS